jgi:hypothetical protein
MDTKKAPWKLVFQGGVNTSFFGSDWIVVGGRIVRGTGRRIECLAFQVKTNWTYASENSGPKAQVPFRRMNLK